MTNFLVGFICGVWAGGMTVAIFIEVWEHYNEK